jgi:hypothetical protein
VKEGIMTTIEVKSIGLNQYRVAGMPGTYWSTRVNAFNHVRYLESGGQIEFIGSVSAGVYGSPGIRPAPNPSAEEQIKACIVRHASKRLESDAPIIDSAWS